jgi:hypothetical protein
MPKAPRVERLVDGPIIPPLHSEKRAATHQNINGPCLVRVPDWVSNPLGRYYLYYADHKGSHIRLAFANDLTGPWQVHRPGALDLSDTPFAQTEPKVPAHIDPARLADPRGPGGAEPPRRLHNSPHRIPGSHRRPNNALDPSLLPRPRLLHAPDHARGDMLQVFWTRVGDAPERILLSEIELTPDWTNWRESEAIEVLRPERPWEGACEPVEPSLRSSIDRPVNHLRDPFVFEDEGQAYLVHAVAGEAGLGIAGLLD